MQMLNPAKRATMAFWYWYVRKLNALLPTVTVGGRSIEVLPGVYKPLENEHACASYCRDGDRVLDLGCGTGVGSVFCASKAREIVAVDISAQAVTNARRNFERHGVTNATASQSDMFDNVEGKFDLILANPPYVEADFEGEEEQFATSVRYLPALFANLDDHLAQDGRLLIQFPLWFRGRIETLAARSGMRLSEVRRLPNKSPGLALLSLAYLQVGFRSAFFLLEHAEAADKRQDRRMPDGVAAE